MKNQYIGGKLHKKGGFGQFADLCEGGGLGQFADLRWAWQKRGQSYPYENHCKCYLHWSMLFTLFT